MFEGIFLEKEIKERLSELKEIDKEMYGYLLNKKIEFNKFKIFKKTIEQTIKRYLLRVAGFEKVTIKEYPCKFIEEYQKRLTGKELIDRINSPSNKKKILYITSSLTFNIVRQSIYLRKAGYETILLMEKSLSLLNLAEKYFDVVYVFNSIYSLSYILKEAKPYLVHVQGTTRNANHFGILAKLLSRSKVVFNFYDIPSTTIAKRDIKDIMDIMDIKDREETELDLFSERFACEMCDGLIFGYSSEVVDILKGRYRINSPMLEFHSYPCDEFMSEDGSKYSYRDGGIHLVHAGGVSPSHLPEKFYGDGQYVRLIDKLTKQGIYFDIYILNVMSRRSRLDYSDYILLSKKNPLFKFKRGLVLDKATKEFSKYDFGSILSCYNEETLYKGINMENHLAMRAPDRFFTLLEAGLPILIRNELRYIADLVRKYEIGIVIHQKDLDNLHKIIESYDREKLKANVKVAKEELSMKRNIGRLIEFYEQVVGNR